MCFWQLLLSFHFQVLTCLVSKIRLHLPHKKEQVVVICLNQILLFLVACGILFVFHGVHFVVNSQNYHCLQVNGPRELGL